MKNENKFVKNVCEDYYVGFDIGTDSVGYAVANEQYELCKFKGEPMWGVTLFDEAQLAVNRRNFRSARRRLDRKQQRTRLLMELFAEEISKLDTNFFKRIKESWVFYEADEDKVRIFDSYEEQKAYVNKYPTIHHLIYELMNNGEAHDPRLVYLACAWLVSHRGHFLCEVDKDNIEGVVDFKNVYNELVGFINREEKALPWSEEIEPDKIAEVFGKKCGITQKTKELNKVLFGEGKPPKEINEQYEYNYDLVIKLICGGKVALKELFGKDEYAELEEKSVSLGWDDEKLASVMQSIGDDAELIRVLKSVYDWSILVDVLKGKSCISEAKIAIYEQHKSDLKTLKYFVRKYIPKKYSELFRSVSIPNNYVAYIGGNNTSCDDAKPQKMTDREEFCKYIRSIFKGVNDVDVDETDREAYDEMQDRLEANAFMPKQVDGDNRVIPYQLYWFELNKILENAKEYIPFLKEVDEDGVSGAEKVLSVFVFRVPYYVGPLKEKSDHKYNHWMVRKAQGKIYPWNFEKTVDLDASEDAFIKRMTNSCSYLPWKDVLPKSSLVYCAFEVLNEINNLKVNGDGEAISVAIKQELYNNVFMVRNKVTPKLIRDYLISNHHIKEEDVISGIDVTIKSSLRPFLQFDRLVKNELLKYSDVEVIINRATYSEDKVRFIAWLRQNYSNLPEDDIKYISGLKFKDFGRLSRELLCDIQGVNRESGEVYTSIIRALWETNCNLMQLLSDKFTFMEEIEKLVSEYYKLEPRSISERLEKMWVSNAVKRPIIRTLDILDDIVKVKEKAPERIFIEMARGADESQKNKRTKTRYDQIKELYAKFDQEEIRKLSEELDEMGEADPNKLQSDKLFLYFLQLGKCLYTGREIDIRSVIAGDGIYNIEHIYPRSFVKDDSIINNEILVESKANGDKSDVYPIAPQIQAKMRGYWEYLKRHEAISEEKFKRLTRTTPFAEDEKFEFINRQLVETRQSTKALATLLKELYPNTEIVYVKAGLVSDFRQEFKLPKSRAVNDLHHAKDAYLNIVAGNVWHLKFSRQFWHADADNNAKVEVVFNHPVFCNGMTVWNGARDRERVVKIARKNVAHITMYSYYKHSGQNGGFFDQNPLRADKGLIPLKKDRPTEIYGGYNSATISGFALVKYKEGKKTEVSLVPIKLLYMDKFISDDEYAKQYILKELREKAKNVEILLGERVLKVYSAISLDGAIYCIRGKSGIGIGLMNLMPFMTSAENEGYIKKLERLSEKYKKNPNYIWSEKHDEVSLEKNIALYNLFIEKMSCWPYKTRPGNGELVKKLDKHRDDFKNLDVFKQTYVLLQILGLFGRMKQADLRDLKESQYCGQAVVSLNLSNWKKNYTDVRIVDRSASGLFESVSENLLELL